MSAGIRRSLERMTRMVRRSSAMQIIAIVFLAAILTGALLLCLPLSSVSREPTNFLTALFTATSATCVTGLTLVETGMYWSSFGQAVILLLIQIGGLGFMTLVSMFFMLAHRKIGLKERMILAQSMGVEELNGILRLLRHVLIGTFSIELLGALVLTLHFLQDMGLGTAVWWGIFHSVSAFCNAGFDIMSAVDTGGSLTHLCTDPTVNVTIMLLITLGGLGFVVWQDVAEHRSFRRLSVYTRLVLILSGVLMIGGAALFAVLEWNNPQTIGDMTTGEKLLACFFQSVTTRTAGYYTVPQSALTDNSKAVSDILMLIGGSSGSTAGGIKTVSVGLLFLSAWATARGKSRVTVFHRTIDEKQIRHAVAIAILMVAVSFSAGIFVSATNGVPLEDSLYETISAIATVGLSTGITAGLNVASKLILIILMFFGRVGIMTISLGFLLSDQAKERYVYSETRMLIG